MNLSSQRIAVLGAAGQLGHDLCPCLPGEVYPLTRSDCDLTNADALREKLQALRPGVVINCAAYNFVDRAEDEKEAAFATNALGIGNLADACAKLDAILVHFSTDYVFGVDEQRRTPYTETDSAGPISVYGVSKLAGERLVRNICPRHFVIRTCGLYGHWGVGGKGGNFVETMLKLATQGKPIKVVNDQICTPSYTADVAEATIKLIETCPFGLYHLTNAGQCSWYEFARAIFEQKGMQPELSPISSAEFGSRAKRPRYSVLTSQATNIKLRPWNQALASYLAISGQRSAVSQERNQALTPGHRPLTPDG